MRLMVETEWQRPIEPRVVMGAQPTTFLPHQYIDLEHPGGFIGDGLDWLFGHLFGYRPLPFVPFSHGIPGPGETVVFGDRVCGAGIDQIKP